MSICLVYPESENSTPSLDRDAHLTENMRVAQNRNITNPSRACDVYLLQLMSGALLVHCKRRERLKHEHLLDRQVEVAIGTNLGEFRKKVALQATKLWKQAEVSDGASVVEQKMAIFSVIERARRVFFQASRIPASRRLQIKQIRVPNLEPYELMRWFGLRKSSHDQKALRMLCNPPEAGGHGIMGSELTVGFPN